MGYSMTQLESKVFIHHTDFRNVTAAINTLMEEASDQPYGHFAWVDTAAVLNACNLTEQLKEWSWHPRYDSYGSIINLAFESEKAGADLKLFKAIAPYVKAGSYIDMQGEEGHMWRWYFNGTDCEELDGTVSFRPSKHGDVIDVDAREVPERQALPGKLKALPSK